MQSETHIGQSILGQELWWHRSTRSSAGDTEEDGIGFPSPEDRSIILARDGWWNLTVSARHERLTALTVLRSALQLSMADVSTIVGSPTGVIYTGTKVETEWLGKLIADKGVKFRITPQYDPSSLKP